VRRVAAGVAVAAALAATGCGGGGGGKGVPAGAAKTPADAVAFISLKTDASNDQWQHAIRLAARFPALEGQLGKIQRYRREVGSEVDYVWSDFRNAGDDSVLLTKPKDLARVKTLLGSDTSSADLGDGWVAFGDYAAQFKKHAEGDKLDGDATFKDAFGNLDDSAPLRAWVRGRSVQAELDRALKSGGAAPEITHELGDLKSIAGFGRAVSDGARIELRGTIDPAPKPATFEPSLPKSTPGGALLYVSATHLRAPLRALVRLIAKSNPNFETELQQVQSALGLTLARDIYPLLEDESSVAVYPAGRIPRILFQQKISDETKADNVLRRIGAIAQFGGGAKVQTGELRGVRFQKLTFKSPKLTIYAGVDKGRIFVTNALGLVVPAPSTTLSDDARYRSARESAHAPRKVAAYAYSDLRRGLPYLFTAGGGVSATTRENAKPLQSAFVYLVRDGDDLKLSGFTAIK
jgi:Protein of unknown function (DUF3352)